jgi:auxin-responsive protein IAA
MDATCLQGASGGLTTGARVPPQHTLREEGTAGCKVVKVAVDGKPYLRKVDLAGARRVRDPAPRAPRPVLFASCNLGARPHGVGRLVDSATGAEYVPTYEDKDADLMLVGDDPFKYGALFSLYG